MRADDSAIDDAPRRPRRVGWSVGDVGSRDGAGGRLWIVSGSDGETLIRPEGSTGSGAWIRAVDRARGPGRLAP